MEETYVNVGYDKSVQAKPSRNQTGPRSSQRRFHAAVVCLGLLSVFQLAGLIGLAVHYFDFVQCSAAELFAVKDNLTDSLQATAELSTVKASLTEERDLLQARLTEITEEQGRLLSLCKQNTTCPRGWKMFSSSCYFFSDESGSWDRGREDCRARGGDLVVIDSTEEQTFLSNFPVAETWSWIGLTDKEVEGTWKWIDGTSLTLRYWETKEPNNGGGNPEWGEEDCAHIRTAKKTENNWNDLSCDASLRWVCEKMV